MVHLLAGSESDLVSVQPALALSSFFRESDDPVRQVIEQTASQICLHPMIFCKPLGGQGFFCGRPRWLDRKLQVAENDLAWM